MSSQDARQAVMDRVAEMIRDRLPEPQAQRVDAFVRQYYARAANGEMVPLSALVRMEEKTAPTVISHFNLFRSTEITGGADGATGIGGKPPRR